MAGLILPKGYNTDPPSVKSSGQPILPGTIFDVPRLMRFVRAGLIEGIPAMDDPTDDQLIATVIDNGMPAWSADQMRYNPALRLRYYLFWLDVREAAKGNAEARERVDAARTAWMEMRKEQVIHDIPNMSVGLWER